mgnify:CR=1 FL=1
MNITRRLALRVCIAALLGTGMMNATAQMQGYATEHVSVLRGENMRLTSAALVATGFASTLLQGPVASALIG